MCDDSRLGDASWMSCSSFVRVSLKNGASDGASVMEARAERVPGEKKDVVGIGSRVGIRDSG